MNNDENEVKKTIEYFSTYKNIFLLRKNTFYLNSVIQNTKHKTKLDEWYQLLQ
jgi:hypothetical protein